MCQKLSFCCYLKGISLLLLLVVVGDSVRGGTGGGVGGDGGVGVICVWVWGCMLRSEDSFLKSVLP